MKTGRLPFNPNHPRNTPLRMAAYLQETPQPHSKVYREYAVPASAYNVYGNDNYGDCVWAAAANLIILHSVHAGRIVIPTLAEVLAGYSAVTGFNPGPPAVNDNGTNMTDALAYLQDTGLGGRKILGWAAVDFTNPEHRKLGVDLFGATYVGVQFPDSAMNEFNAGVPWNDVGLDAADGHCILHPGYGEDGDDYVTWARWEQKASAAWSAKYVDEEYVIITQDWADYVTRHDNGELDLAGLFSDLKNL